MSLVDNAMEKSYIIDKTTAPDGRGGVITTYKAGAEINVAYSFDSSTQARVAQQADTNDRYTLTTRRSVNLQYHDIVQRVRDGKYFRVTSDGDDNFTPNSSPLDIRQVQAEEWKVPTNG